MNSLSGKNITPKLIIIRGPSASGKSTVADELFNRCTRPTLLISEDTIRKLLSDHKTTGYKVARQIERQAILIGLQNGYDVIYHGILPVVGEKANRFDELLKQHPKDNYFFYLDVSFEETVLRHSTRAKQSEFSPEAMKKWWDFSSPTEHASETIIGEKSALKDTLMTINAVTGLSLQRLK